MLARSHILCLFALVASQAHATSGALWLEAWDALLQSNQPDPIGFLPAAFGGGVARAGDVNGDSFDDVIVGAPGWDGGDPHEGAAFVFLGSATGIVGGDPTTAQAHLESNQFGAQFGTVAGAGDVNGDGYDDIIVGAHFYDDVLPGTSLSVDGAAFVFLGSAAGIVGSDPSSAHAWIHAKSLASDLGLSVAGAGDINGDGYDDVLVGVPKQGVPFPPPIEENQSSGDGGAVLVFHGSAAGITGTGFSDADAVLLPYPPGSPVASQSYMGSDVAGAGDVNGDGYDDIIVHAAGEAVIFLGSAGGIVGSYPGDAHARITADLPGVGLGIVSGAGDVNGDGYDDILVSNPNYPIKNSTTQEGAAFVFLGGPSGILDTDSSTAHASFFGNLLAEWVGISLSGAGDVDGDGFDDILVGARVYPGSLSSEGVVYLFRGGPSGISAGSLLEADARIEARQSGAIIIENNGAFSVAGAGDVNGDGFYDVIMGKGYWDEGEENEGAAFVFHGEPVPANLNQPPVAFAGADRVVADTDDDGSEMVTVQGSGFDPDGSIVGYAWYEGETLLGSSPTLTTSLATSGDHTLVLVVTDDAGVSRGDPVTVRVELVDDVQLFFDNFSAGLGSWSTSGDVTLSSSDPFPDAPQVRLGAAGASLSRTIAMPLGSTGMTVSFWAKASQFDPADEVFVRVSVDGGPYATVYTFTSAASGGGYNFYGGSAIPLGHSWFPATATSIELQFLSNTNSGLFFVDDVKVRGLLANLDPVADAGPDESASDDDGDGVEAFHLDGSASFDPDGSIASYEWRDGATLLGWGPTLDVSLSVGSHDVVLTVTDDAGAIGSAAKNISVEGVVGTLDAPVARALGLRVYPNPFNPSASIEYVLPRPGKVSLRIYDLAGRLVRVLEDSKAMEAGRYVTRWTGTDRGGSPVASGVYLCRLKLGQELLVRRLTLLK